jgi:ankyrin repeat protein
MILVQKSGDQNLSHELIDKIIVKGLIFCKHDLISMFPKLRCYRKYFNRVISIYHFMLAPNLNRCDLQKVIDELRSPDLTIGEIRSWLHKYEIQLNNFKSYLSFPENIDIVIKCVDFIWILDDDYENILHHSVKMDNTSMIRYLCSINSENINQSNRMNYTAAHFSADLLYIHHLHIFVGVKCFDPTIIDFNGNTFLMTLLKRIFQKKRLELCLQVIQIIKKIEEHHNLLFSVEDNNGFNVVDYAVAIGDCRLVELLLQRTPSKDIESNLTRYFKQAIILNNSGMVSLFLPRVLARDMSPSSPSSPSSSSYQYLHFAISVNAICSLDTLLSNEYFVLALNAIDRSGNNALKTTLDLSSRQGLSLDFLRRILTRGANPFSKWIPLKDREDQDAALLKCGCFYDVSVHQKYVVADNIFTAAASCHNTDFLRVLLLQKSKNSSCCVPFSTTVLQCKQKISASHLGLITDSLSSRSLHFYFDCVSLSSNPLAHCLLLPAGDSQQLLTTKSKTLEYLLFHTPFVDLINMQDNTGLTPLALTCATLNISALCVLLNSGVNPMTYLNSSFICKLSILYIMT